MKTKKIIALFLSLTMMVGMLPAMVSAAETDEEIPEQEVTEVAEEVEEVEEAEAEETATEEAEAEAPEDTEVTEVPEADENLPALTEVEAPVISAAVAYNTPVSATTSVTYIDESGIARTASNAMILTEQDTILTGGTYVVNSNLILDHGLMLEGNVSLIIEDGASLTIGSDEISLINPGIECGDYDLAVFGQEEGTGSLSVHSQRSYGIWSDAGDISFAGGIVDVTSDTKYGIISFSGDVNFYSGNLRASHIYGENINLHWNKSTDSVYTPDFKNSVKFRNTFIDESGNEFSGTVQAFDVDGVTLHPVGTIDAHYVDENGEDEVIRAFVITSSDTVLKGGWYIVRDNPDLNSLEIKGDSKIILADGCNLSFGSVSAKNFINCHNSNIIFYGQTENTGFFSISVYSGNSDFDMMYNVGSITIVGGSVSLSTVTNSMRAINGAGSVTVLGGSLTCGQSIVDTDTFTAKGGTIYISGPVCADSMILDWTSAGDNYRFADLSNIENITLMNTFTCQESDETWIGTYSGYYDHAAFDGKTLVPSADALEGPALEGYSATVADDIGVKFYFKIPDNMKDSNKTKVVFTLEGEDPVEVPFDIANKEAPAGGENYYFFRFNVYCTQLTTPVKAELKYDGTTMIVKDDFTVRDYIVSGYERTHDVSLLLLLRYGSSLQKVFHYRENDLADKNMEDYVSADVIQNYFINPRFADSNALFITAHAPEPEISYSIPGVTYYSTSLVVKEKIYLKHYFEITDPADFNIDDYSAFDSRVLTHNNAVEYTDIGLDSSGKYIYVKVPVMMGECNDADTPFCLYYGDPMEDEFIHIEDFTPVAYMKKVLNSDYDQNIKDAMIYLYAFADRV